MRKKNSIRIAVIGDIHLDLNQFDIEYFNNSDYDLILIVGDLGGFMKPKSGLVIAERLSQLDKPTLIIPGNHDVHNVFQIIAEVIHNRNLARLAGMPHLRFHRKIKAILEPAVLTGYRVHPLQIKSLQFDVITARPYAMGGSDLSYRPLLRRLFGIQNQKDSIELLCRQVDQAKSGIIIFLAHNGPYGLGQNPTDIWGCDFNPDFGDFGDNDLTEAIKYAASIGKRVLAVIAGHMHLQTYLEPKPIWQRRGAPGPIRPYIVEEGGITYLNAARVPRIYWNDNTVIHHHIGIEFDGVDIDVKEMLIQNIEDN